jgi:hypothetical protein
VEACVKQCLLDFFYLSEIARLHVYAQEAAVYGHCGIGAFVVYAYDVSALFGYYS